MSHQNVVRVCAQAPRCAALVSAVLFTVVLVFSSASARAASTETPGETFPVSVTPEGVYADGEGAGEFTPVSISDDGRYVSFESSAANLGEQGPDGVNEAFVKDLQTGEVRLVSRADGLDGEPAGEPGVSNLKLSGDGRYAIFTSAATDLGTVLPEEEVLEQHVYRRDLQTGETALVDRVTGVDGEILSRGAEAAAISADGRYVVFTADVENLEDPLGDHAETTGAVGYVRDLQAGTTAAVSRTSGAAGEIGDEPAEGLSISADGRFVAFSSRATNLVPGMEANIWEQVYLRDLQTSATSLLSQNALGEVGDRGSGFPTLSAEGGCKVEFNSNAFNLLSPSPLVISGDQVYVVDHCAGAATMTLVSQNEQGIANFAYSLSGGTADGRYALFAAEFPGSECCHLYLRDLQAEQTSQVDRASGAAGASANAEVEQVAISANGCRVVFASRATNLYGAGPPAGPGGEKPSQVYARQLAPCAELPEDPGTDGLSSKGSSPTNHVPAAPVDLGIARLDNRKLVLDLSGPGSVTIRVRRFVSEPRHHWKFLRTLAASAETAGRIEVALPDFPAGRYRFNVHLDQSRSPGTVRLLTIRPQP